MKEVFLLILFCSIIFSLGAQDQLERKISALFEDNQSELEVQYFHGRLEGMQEVGMAVACTEKECRGVLRYIRSGEELNLKGSLKKGKLELQELNNFGKICGFIEGDLSTEIITAWWAAPEKVIFADLRMKRVDAMPQKGSNCGKGKWIRYFSSPESTSKILLQKHGDHALVGSFFHDDSGQNFLLEGGITNDGHYELAIFSGQEEVGSMLGQFEGKGIQNILFNWNDGIDNSQKFISKDRLFYGCLEYGDYMGYYSMTYPLTRYEAFNIWVEQQVSSWAKMSKNILEEKRRQNPKMDPEFRSSHIGNVWTDIDYFDQSLISGSMVINNNSMSVENTQPFIFDFENLKLITREEIFSDNNQILKLVDTKKKSLLKNYTSNIERRDWLKEQNFDLLSMQYNGFVFSTSFHPIFGREKISVPFAEVENLLVDGSMIASILELSFR